MSSREEVKFDLLAVDTFLSVMHASVVLTFEGKLDETVAYLRQRIFEIAKVNPALTGKVVKTGMMKAHLVHFKEATMEDIDEMVEVTDNEELCAITSETPFADMQKRLVKYMKPHIERVTHVAVWPGESEGLFRVHFSMNHGFADGSSLYRYLNMVSQDEEVVALDVERRTDFEKEKGFDLWLPENYPSPTSFARMGGMLYRMAWMKLCPWRCEDRVGCYKVSNDYIAKMKKEHSTDGGFVSTNDIVTSWWFNRMSNAIVRMMAINVRGRVPGYGNDLVGNYLAPVGFDRSEKVDPKVVRQSIVERARKKGPAFTQYSTYRWCADDQVVITNWSTFYKTLTVPGAVQKHHLAMPVMGGMPRSSTCIVYKSSDEQTNIVIDLDPTVRHEVRLPDAAEEEMLEAIAH